MLLAPLLREDLAFRFASLSASSVRRRRSLLDGDDDGARFLMEIDDGAHFLMEIDDGARFLIEIDDGARSHPIETFPNHPLMYDDGSHFSLVTWVALHPL